MAIAAIELKRGVRRLVIIALVLWIAVAGTLIIPIILQIRAASQYIEQIDRELDKLLESRQLPPTPRENQI